MPFNRIKERVAKFIRSLSEPAAIDIKQCVKDPTQECPSRTLIHVGGRMENVGFTSCCKFFDQIKKMNKSISMCEPDKNYNGTSFSRSVVESSKRAYDETQNIEYVGPVCEKNKRVIK